MTINIENIKSPYKELLKIFIEHGNKKVNTVLKEFQEEIEALAAYGGGSDKKFIRCAKTGKVIAILCWYHLRWELLVGENATKYGLRSKSATGYNYMCADGNRKWNAKYAVYKTAFARLEGSGAQGDAFNKANEQLIATRSIVDLESPGTPEGYETKEEALEALEALGFKGV